MPGTCRGLAAELDEGLDALPELLADVALPEAAEPDEVADAVRVTPAAAQDC